MHVAHGINGRAVRIQRFMFHWPTFAEFSRFPTVKNSQNFEPLKIQSTINESKIRSGTSMCFARMELAEFSGGGPTVTATFSGRPAVDFQRMFGQSFVGSTRSTIPQTA